MRSPGRSTSQGSTDHAYGYFKSFDGLRAYAIVVVMMTHVSGRVGLVGGFIGVDVFFVLSGFLITTLLIGEFEKTHSIRMAAFYARRALRLLPALFGAIALAMLFVLVVSKLSHSGAKHDTLSSLPATLLFFANWPDAFLHDAKNILIQTWSLGVEEQFYLVWPICFISIFSRLRHLFSSIILAIAALGVMVYAIVAVHLGWQADRVYFGTDTHCGGLLLGCGLAFLMSSGLHIKSRFAQRCSQGLCIAAIALILAITCFVRIDEGTFWIVAIALTSIATTMILFTQIAAPIGWVEHTLESKVFKWIGKRSYGLYLWHYPIFQALFTITVIHEHPVVIGTVPCFALSFIVAALSYRYLEQPVLGRWKRRFQSTEAIPVAERSATT